MNPNVTLAFEITSRRRDIVSWRHAQKHMNMIRHRSTFRQFDLLLTPQLSEKSCQSPNEAFVAPWTAKATIYCADIATGLMVTQLTKYLRQLAVDRDIHLRLSASELSVG